uniref:Uncharacterized protein n=1 Tax=Oryza sativa subsp. japonica TaxID=39947 RepID=Q6L4H6_ORYSJ|nr:hypothetical protein [Oryza sativa Japonica Group]AAT47097.1 hypothetical protein [Oryza sativa Japonica Group]
MYDGLLLTPPCTTMLLLACRLAKRSQRRSSGGAPTALLPAHCRRTPPVQPMSKPIALKVLQHTNKKTYGSTRKPSCRRDSGASSLCHSQDHLHILGTMAHGRAIHRAIVIAETLGALRPKQLT